MRPVVNRPRSVLLYSAGVFACRLAMRLKVRAGSIQNLDFPLLICTLGSLAVGVAMVFSATSGDKGYALRQAGFGLVGLLLLFAVAYMDYSFLESFTIPLYLGTLG